MTFIQTLSDHDSELMHGGWGSLLDISVLNGADFGQGSNFFVGYLGGGAISQATNGGTAISAGDDIENIAPAPQQANGYTVARPGLALGNGRPSFSRRKR